MTSEPFRLICEIEPPTRPELKDPLVEVVTATPSDRIAALEVWRAANTARGLGPSTQRQARVHQKIQDIDALLVVARHHGTVVAMALAEPARADDGAGEIVPGHSHISMVFVDPSRWGQRIGTALMAGLHEHAGKRGWTTLTLWTRQTNTRAQRLYAAAGYRPNGRSSLLSSDDPIVQLKRP